MEIRHVDDVIARAGKLDLREVVDQMVIAAVGVDDDDLIQAVARNLAAGGFQQAYGQFGFDADAAGVVARFQDLGEYEVRKNDSTLQCGGTVAQFAGDEHVGPER